MVNPCSRQSWGFFSRDILVGFDVTIHAKSIEEASDVASKYWHDFHKYHPLMGHVEQFNLQRFP